MKFKGFIGRDGSYLVFDISGGDSSFSIGDQTWFDPNGNILLVLEYADREVLMETANLFLKESDGYEFLEQFWENK